VPTARAPRPARPDRRTRLVLTALAVLALSALAPAARAADGPGPVEITGQSAGQCLAGRFCVWSGADFTGAFWSVGSAGTSTPVVTTARSVWNRMAVDVYTYPGAGATGTPRCWSAGAQTGSTSAGTLTVRTMDPSTC
jgi:hypothetical protein